MTLGFPVPAASVEPEVPVHRRRGPVFARRGVIASQHPLVSATGLRVLAEGGNAVDAAVAAALVGSVILPSKCGIGGDLFAIIHRPGRGAARGDLLAFMGSGVGPGGVTADWLRERGEDSPTGRRVLVRDGALSPTVPGFIDGVFAMLDRFGSRSFADLADRAIGYARDGFPLSLDDAGFIAQAADRLARHPATAAVFLPDGRPPRVGELLRQPDLARSLGQIAAGGAGAFYRGGLARRIVAGLRQAGGVLSEEDFAGHATDVAPPLATTYRGQTVYETRLPSQGFVVLEALNIVERADIGSAALTTADAVHVAVEALKSAFADRNALAGDPNQVDVPLDRLTSKAWAAERYAAIDPGRAASEPPAVFSPAHTTSLCCADADGLLVSLIWSVSGAFGSGVVAGDTGILLNNRAGDCFSLDADSPNLFAPGKRPMHTLNCYLVADADGTPVLAGGTPGGDYQPQWNLQTLSALIDGGLDAQAATEVPRWQVWPATYPADLGHPYELRVEDRLGNAVIADLEARGHRVARLGPWGAGGAVQVVARHPETGVLAAGSDPRAEGLAIGL